MTTRMCENIFCIYWEDNTCILDSISLDIQGTCRDCIYIELEESILSKARKDLLEKLEQRYNKNHS